MNPPQGKKKKEDSKSFLVGESVEVLDSGTPREDMEAPYSSLILCPMHRSIWLFLISICYKKWITVSKVLSWVL
jgi:hypothetical protein